ncbi:MAG: GNAT family N-acetyltransferase [Tenericutes bacterium]|nr:GNAT family N-acetyltransferase [Mycoplasmatota bacterium]
MITIINKNNMNFPNDNFLTKEEVSTELENNPYGNYLILIEEDKITGYIYYSDIYERAEINQFEVKTTHRNCGKGNELLKHLIEKLQKNITLEVKQTNASAIHLYEKNGFKKVAIRKGYYNGIDGILMERTMEE